MVDSPANGHTWSARRVSVALTIFALGLWAYSIAQAEFNIGLCGLIHGLPNTFFVALGILTIASAILWVSPEKHGRLLFIQLGFLTVSLWLTPLITGGSQSNAATQYLYTGWAEYVVREGHFAQDLFLFHNWPGAFGLVAAMTIITGLPGPYALVVDPSIVSFLVMLVYMLLVYVFLKNMLGNEKPNLCWAGLWIFAMAYWIQGAYLGPSTFGYILLLMTLVLLVRRLEFGPDVPVPSDLPVVNRILGCLALVCITVTHLLSSFVTIAAVGMLWIAKRMPHLTLPFLLGAAFLIFWLVVGATAFLEAHVPVFIDETLRLDIIFRKGIFERVAGSESREAVSQIRVWFSLLFIAIAFFGLVVSRRSRRRIHGDNTAIIIALAFVIVAALLSFGGGKEMFERTFHFLLPVVAYFSVALLTRKPTAVVLSIVLLIALPLHFISHYGAQEMDYFPSGSLSASHHFSDHTTKGDLISGEFPLFIRVEDYEYYETGIYFQELMEDQSLLYRPIEPGWPQYVSVGTRIEARNRYLYDDATSVAEIQASMEVSTEYDLVYVNRDTNLYLRE